MEFDSLSNKIIGAAIEVHKILGPGLLESAYEECLSYELSCKGISHKRQLPLPLVYKDIKLEHGYRIDILVEEKIIIEIKSIEVLSPLHEAQILTYLRFAKKEIGLLINFNVLQLKQGIRRFVMSHK